MKLLDRYLLREYLITTFYCVSALTLVQVVYDLFYNFPKLMAAHITFPMALRYYFGSMAPNLQFMLPAAVLLATLYTLWQLSRQGELTAMRASGISLYRLMAPFLLVGIAFSGATALLQETVAPSSAYWAMEFKNNSFKEPETRPFQNLAYYNTLDRRMWMIGEIDFKKPHILLRSRIGEERPDRTLIRDWHVGRAEWMDQQWWLFDVEVQDYNQDGNPLGTLRPLSGSEHGLEMNGWSETPSDFENEVKPSQFMTAREIYHYQREHPNISPKAMAQARVDFHLHLAMPWACLIVTLFGIPAGARTARQSMINGVLSALLFFVVFYALTQIGAFAAKRELLAPWLGAWLSNIVFLAAGLRILMLMR